MLVASAAFNAVFIARTSFRAHGQAFFTLLDDAMISMRYAQHLAEGHGLVWNVGQPPVQGFTNLGWTLIMAILHLLDIPQNYVALSVMIVAALILLVLVIVAYRLCEEIWPSANVAPLLAATVTAFYFPLTFWSLRGMEVGLLALLVSLATLAALQLRDDAPKRALGLGLLLSAAVLVRLDALPQVAMILAYVAVLKGLGRAWKWLPAAIVLLTVGVN